MNGAQFLDDLARTLAEPMPRRRVLGVLGATLAAVLVPSAQLPKALAARRIACYPNPCLRGLLSPGAEDVLT